MLHLLGEAFNLSLGEAFNLSGERGSITYHIIEFHKMPKAHISWGL